MFYLISFFYGAAIGSFVQVVATRLNVAPIIRSRSKCLSCGSALAPSDLVPIFSYLFLRGKCRYCHVPYGKEALLIESLFGGVFVLLYHFILAYQTPAFFVFWVVYYTFLFIALGVIALYDYRHSYVPVFFLTLFSLLSLVMMGMRYMHDPSFSVLLGPLVVSLPFLIVWLVTKGRALGFGDVLLYISVGGFFGIEQGLAVLFISVWLGALVGSYIYFSRRRKGNMNTAIPFVPYIVAAFLIVLFTDMDIFSIAQLFA